MPVFLQSPCSGSISVLGTLKKFPVAAVLRTTAKAGRANVAAAAQRGPGGVPTIGKAAATPVPAFGIHTPLTFTFRAHTLSPHCWYPCASCCQNLHAHPCTLQNCALLCCVGTVHATHRVCPGYQLSLLCHCTHSTVNGHECVV